KDDTINELVSEIKEFSFEITSLCDYDNAQVCAGGVNLKDINPESFESRMIKGLYVVGEMLDIDGQCGGYNITFALCSGIRAGRAIC
ncbi:MAG: NAD(P)/FAD-dependent oxidoreductase, partial [Wujia sp.]